MLSNSIISSSSKIDVLLISSSQKFISAAIDESSFNEFFASCSIMDKARMLALQNSTQGLMFDVPLDKVRGFVLSNHDLRFFISSRLGLSNICNDGDICPKCNAVMDPEGYHIAVCSTGTSVVHRHNALRDLVREFCSKAVLNPAKENECESSTLIPADIYLPRGGSAGIPLALDITVIHPLQVAILPKSSVESGRACAFAEEKKHKKYDITCDMDNIDFIPLAVEFFGLWGEEATKFFDKLAKLIAARSGSSPANILLDIYRKLSVCLIRCNAQAVSLRTPDLID
jgi:hypothetical protein